MTPGVRVEALACAARRKTVRRGLCAASPRLLPGVGINILKRSRLAPRLADERRHRVYFSL